MNDQQAKVLTKQDEKQSLISKKVNKSFRKHQNRKLKKNEVDHTLETPETSIKIAHGKLQKCYGKVEVTTKKIMENHKEYKCSTYFSSHQRRNGY